jgi:hypothetical protein
MVQENYERYNGTYSSKHSGKSKHNEHVRKLIQIVNLYLRQHEAVKFNSINAQLLSINTTLSIEHDSLIGRDSLVLDACEDSFGVFISHILFELFDIFHSHLIVVNVVSIHLFDA